MKQLSKITQSQINAKGVQSLSDRPNAISQYGASGLSPHQLKLAFDKLATFLAGKINEVVDTLSSEAAADYIRLALDEYEVGSLEDLISAMLSGSFAENILQVYPSANSFETVPLQRCINDTAKAISENKENIEDLFAESGASIKDELNKETNILTIRLFNKSGEEVSSISVDLKVNTDRLIDGSVTTEKLADRSVSNDKLANFSVSSAKIENHSVTSLKLADNSVVSSKISFGAVSEDKLSNDIRNRFLRVESDSIKIDNKVDKLTTTSGIQVYGRVTGEERAITATQDKTSTSLAYRGSTGTFKVGEPTEDSHPATKGYVDTKNAEVEAIADEALVIAKGAAKSLSFLSYSDLINYIKGQERHQYSTGQHFLVKTINVPDVWVYGESSSYNNYQYVDDETFANALVDESNDFVQVGYYILSALETQKVDLTDYVKNTDYGTSSKAGLVKYSAAQGTFISQDGTISLVGANESTIEKKASSGQPIMPKHLDYAVKVGITTNAETLSDDEKIKACEWIGAVKKPEKDAGGYNVLPIINHLGEDISLRISNKPLSSAIPQYGSGGVLQTNTPTSDLHCANKKYVDDAVGGTTKLYLHTLSDGAEGFKIISTSAEPMTWIEDVDGNGFATPIYSMLAAYYFNPTVSSQWVHLKVGESYSDTTIHIILAEQTSLILTSDMTDVVTEH